MLRKRQTVVLFLKEKFPLWFLLSHLYLIDFVHPIAGKLKYQFGGLHRGRHGGGVQRAGSSLKYPGSDDSGSFSESASPQENAFSVVVVLTVSALGETPQAEF